MAWDFSSFNLKYSERLNETQLRLVHQYNERPIDDLSTVFVVQKHPHDETANSFAQYVDASRTRFSGLPPKLVCLIRTSSYGQVSVEPVFGCFRVVFRRLLLAFFVCAISQKTVS